MRNDKRLPSGFIDPIDTSNEDAQMFQLDNTDRIQGHTISQRLRKLKQIPPELYPLGKSTNFQLRLYLF